MRRRTEYPAMLLAALSILVLLRPGTAAAQEPLRSISVTGEAEERVHPDMVSFRTGVTVTASRIQQAREEMEERSRRVLAALEGAAVAGEDIQTGHLAVHPRYRWDEGEQILTGYQAAQWFDVTVRELAGWETILSSVLEAGATEIQGPRYDLSDRREREAAVQVEALRSAREKAERLAAAAGAKLGPVIRISEPGSPSQPVSMIETTSLMEGRGGGGPSTAPGELVIRARIHVEYELSIRPGR